SRARRVVGADRAREPRQWRHLRHLLAPDAAVTQGAVVTIHDNELGAFKAVDDRPRDRPQPDLDGVTPATPLGACHGDLPGGVVCGRLSSRRREDAATHAPRGGAEGGEYVNSLYERLGEACRAGPSAQEGLSRTRAPRPRKDSDEV